MGEALKKFEKEIEDAHTIGKSFGTINQVSYEIDANSFTGEVELHTYVTPAVPLKYIKVNVVLSRSIP